MVYSGLELGQYFELESDKKNNECHNVSRSLNKAWRFEQGIKIFLSDFHVANTNDKNDTVNCSNAIYL